MNQLNLPLLRVLLVGLDIGSEALNMVDIVMVECTGIGVVITYRTISARAVFLALYSGFQVDLTSWLDGVKISGFCVSVRCRHTTLLPL